MFNRLASLDNWIIDINHKRWWDWIPGLKDHEQNHIDPQKLENLSKWAFQFHNLSQMEPNLLDKKRLSNPQLILVHITIFKEPP